MIDERNELDLGHTIEDLEKARSARVQLCLDRGLPLSQACMPYGDPAPAAWAWRYWSDPRTPGEWVVGNDLPAVMPDSAYEVVQLGAVRHLHQPCWPPDEEQSSVPVLVDRLEAVIEQHPELQPVKDHAALLMQCVHEALAGSPVDPRPAPILEAPSVRPEVAGRPCFCGLHRSCGG